MSKRDIEGQRFALTLPNGETVTVTATAEMMARAQRVRDAIEQGKHPDPDDLALLFAYLSEDS